LIAEAIFSGTELLLGQILNTNAQTLQRTLANMGIALYHMITVGDNRQRCAAAILQAASRADIIIVGGGLGPTVDDVSREALSEAVGVPLNHNETALAVVQRGWKGAAMPETALVQALVPDGGMVLDNPIGIAPGIILEQQEKTFILLPGPPDEFELMLSDQVVPYLKSRYPEELGAIHTRVLKLGGTGESYLVNILGDLFKSSNPTVSTCVKGSFIDLSITAKADDEQAARRAIEEMEGTLRKYIDEYIFGINDDTLPGVVGQKLARQGYSLAVAEELSGGHLARMLLEDPLSAGIFAGGMVLRGQELGAQGLPERLLRPTDLPEPEAAEYLASVFRQLTGSSIGMAVLGPTARELRERTRSTVTVAIDLENEVSTEELWLWDTRNQVAVCAAEMALLSLWRLLKRQGL
jgi:nicotinamide-nucleotide amidase